jgi:hypothetical protein
VAARLRTSGLEREERMDFMVMSERIVKGIFEGWW